MSGNINTTDDLKKTISDLQEKVDFLMQKRMGQVDYLPQSVKNRTMGEANSFIYSGLAANKPDIPQTTSLGTAVFYATDTDTLYLWDGTTWNAH